MDASAVSRAWPVSWDRAAAYAPFADTGPDAILHDHRLAAHRVLDRWAAAAFDVSDGIPGAREALETQIAAALQELPWLTPTDANRGADDRESDCAGCGSAQTPGGATHTSGVAPDTLLNDDALSGLASRARALGGGPAVTAVRRLTAAARSAEQHLVDPVTPHDGSGTAVPGVARGQFDTTFWGHVIATTNLDSVSMCQGTLIELSEEDLVNFPVPTGTPTNSTGIQRVDVPDPCGPAPRMTIHGSGFGARQPPRTSVIVATWDTSTATSQLTYVNAQTLSWADDTIVVQLPSTVVSGYAAFSDLQFVTDYNKWAAGRNSRINTAMHAHGCPGQWTVEDPLALYPSPQSTASYRAGAPVLMAQLSAGAGPTRMFDSQTLYLHPGDPFILGWRVYGADTLTLRPANGEDAAAQILSAAGYPASGAILTPADNELTLTAPLARSAAAFELDADNGCGTVTSMLSVLSAGPALAPPTMSIIQSLPAGSDVAVTTNGGTETLNPATGNAIPLVAGKRTVVRIDWCAATEQLALGACFTAEASVHVSGDMLPFGGVDVPICASTADSTPASGPVILASGPGFDSYADYEHWAAATEPSQQSFFAVLPAEICLGGTIFGTNRPALTAVSATITVTSPNGLLTWTLTAGAVVTFHQRRKVTLRYVPFGPTDPSQAPTDEQCEAALRAAGSMLPVPDPEIYRLPGPVLNAAVDQHLVEDLEAQRTAQQGAFSNATWRDEIWLVMGGSSGVNRLKYCAASSIDPVTCAHELAHSYFQNHLDVCGGVPISDPMSTWPDNGFVPVEGWDAWNDVDVPVSPPKIDIMAYGYCPPYPGWMHPERWRRIFLQAGPPP